MRSLRPRSAFALPVIALAALAACTSGTRLTVDTPSAVAAAPLTPYPGGTWQPGPPRYAATAAEEVALTMDDGVVLRVGVVYPADSATGRRADGRFPVTIEMTPYERSMGAPASPSTYLARHGYIQVVVRPRGTAGSTGEVQQFTSRDGLDGKAVVDWAAHQLAGSDGRVAVIGCSYPGAIALATAAQVAPNSPLKAIIASCIGLDMQHRQVWTTNGLPNGALGFYIPRAAAIMGNSPSAGRYFTTFHEGVMAGGPEAYDGYWKDRLPMVWAQRIAERQIPVLLWTGWADINEIGAINAYAALQNAAAGRPFYAPMAENTPVSPRYQLIMGDWAHGQGLDEGVYLQWLETWVKGIETGIERTTTPMHLFEHGTNRWINVARYPLARDYTEWYLASQSTLTSARPASAATLTLAYTDPDSSGGRLRLETPVFTDGATLAGPMSVTVHARSSNTNMALLATLYDVAPDGTPTRITFGGLLGSQRALNSAWSWTDVNGAMVRPWPTLERDEYLTPGAVYRFDVPLAARQYGVAPGHRLRLELTTQSSLSACPRAGAVPFISEPCRLTAPQERTLPGGTYTILSGPEHPSALNLPLLPWRAFPTARSGPAPSPAERPGSPGARSFTLPLDWGA